MVVYDERVEMITANRRLYLLAVAGGLLAYILHDVGDWGTLTDAIVRHMHLTMAAGAMITLALSNQLQIELTNDSLRLRAGVSRRNIWLKDIIAAKALGENLADESRFPFLATIGLHVGFVSDQVQSGVRISLPDGKTLDFSSNHPVHLASMIDQLAQQAVAREASESASHRGSTLATAVRNLFSSKG